MMIGFLSPEVIVALLGLRVPDLVFAVDLGRIPQYAVNGLVFGSILALAAVGLTMVYGILRVANFAHGDMLTLGTYFAFYFVALIALPATLTWGFIGASVLLVLVALDRWSRDPLARLSKKGWLSRRPALSDTEAMLVVYGAVALLVLVAGVWFDVGVAGAWAAALVAVLVAAPVAVRVQRTGEHEDWRRFGSWVLGAVGAVFIVTIMVHFQAGFGWLSFPAGLAVFFAVVVYGGFVVLRSPGDDPWVVGALAVAGLVGVFLFASKILLAIVLAMAGVALFSILLERIVWRRARRQGAGLLTLIIISIGIMLALRNTIAMVWETRQRSFPGTLHRGQSILGSDVVITPHQALAVAVTMVTILLLHLFLRYTKVGKAMRALGDDMELARISGIDVDRIVIYVWMIAGGLAALAGILFGFLRPFNTELGWLQLLPIFAAVILGGIGSPYGALLGAFTIGLAMEISPAFGVAADYKLAVGFGILILVMILRPRGILGVKDAR